MITPKAKITDKNYLKWLVTQPCVTCGRRKNEYLDIVYAHQTLGHGIMGGKGHDIWALPLCVECHAREHRGHKTFWGGFNLRGLIVQHWRRYRKETGRSVFTCC